MIRYGRSLLAAALTSLICGSAPAQRGDLAGPLATYEHRQTGWAFPARIGPAIRGDVVRNSDDGANVDVVYQIMREGEKTNGGVIANLTVSIYPTTIKRPCIEAFNELKHDLVSSQKFLTVKVQDEPPAPPAAPSGLTGFRIAYEGRMARIADLPQPVIDDVRLYCIPGDEWHVLYSITTPAVQRADADVAAVIAALGWPDRFKR